jgi:phosphatidylglycerophosphate synthase
VIERWLIAFSVLLALGAGAAFFLYVSVLYIIVGIAICVGALLFFVLGYSARMREKVSNHKTVLQTVLRRLAGSNVHAEGTALANRT